MASLAPLVGCFWLASHRHRRLLDAEGGHAADLRLSLLSPDGTDVPLDSHAAMRVDGAVARSDRFDVQSPLSAPWPGYDDSPGRFLQPWSPRL